eukprot:230831-Rhodomonas_salina.2
MIKSRSGSSSLRLVRRRVAAPALLSSLRVTGRPGPGLRAAATSTGSLRVSLSLSDSKMTPAGPPRLRLGAERERPGTVPVAA